MLAFYLTTARRDLPDERLFIRDFVLALDSGEVV